EADQMHQSRGFDPETGLASASGDRTWTGVFGEEIVRLAERRDDIVAVTAAMCDPTGLSAFKHRFPERLYDVGIAEQHALTSAAGLASGGLHPVVAIYATFINRAYDQLLMDVALHELPVTLVLDRAGITGEDGASHNGMWDLALLGTVPGIRIAAPRDEATLRAELAEAIEHAAGPTVLRFPKTPLGPELPALRRVGGVDILAEPGPGADVDVLVVAVGATAGDVLDACAAVGQAGYSVRVVDPCWVTPVDPALLELAHGARLVVTVEDGIAQAGVGSRLAQELRDSGNDVATRELGIPTKFLPHGKVADVRAHVGLTVQDIGRRIVEWSALVQRGSEPGSDVHAGRRAGDVDGV
ncbi:MAG: transketolase C-terminal domain-containing protein, partial [Pseudonocardiales bacterium]